VECGRAGGGCGCSPRIYATCEYKLSRSLDDEVEDCVNAVGVDANTASAPLPAALLQFCKWLYVNRLNIRGLRISHGF
jgi:hypothetical protein